MTVFPMVPFWSLLTFVNDSSVTSPSGVRLEDIESWSGKLLAKDEDVPDEFTGTPFQMGDVLFGKLRPYLAKSWLATNEGAAVGDIHVYRPNPNVTEPRFLAYIARTPRFIAYAEGSSEGVKMPRCEWSKLRQFPTPLPDLDTQRRIADYLDAETAQIDTLTAELDGYVELLEKRKESLSKKIIDGLTKDFKDVQCKFIVDTTTGSGDTQDATQEGEYPFYVRSDHIESATEWTFDTDAVLTSGDGAGVGKIYHLASGKFHAHQRVYVMRNFRQAIPEYYYWAFKHRFTESMQYGGAKSTVESVRMNMITDLKIPLPDLDTQRRIADYLDKETARIDTLIKECRELKEILLKRRQVLITDVVTGKVEV